MNRKKLNALFKTEETIDGQTGKTRRTTRYIGPYYHVDQVAVQRARRWLGTMSIGCLVCYAATGLMTTASSRSALVMVIYLLSALALYHGFCGWLEMRRMTDPIDEVTCEETIRSTQNAMLAQTILGSVWFISNMVFLLTDPLPHDGVKEVVYILCVSGFTALSCKAWRVMDALKPEKIDQEEWGKNEGDKNNEAR